VDQKQNREEVISFRQTKQRRMQCPVLQCFEEMAGLYADIPPSREPEEQQQGQGDGDGQDGRAGRGAALEIKHLVINDGIKEYRNLLNMRRE